MVKKDPCKRYACDIQKCLQGNNYNEDACTVAIDRLTSCCERFDFTPLVCEGIPRKDTNQEITPWFHPQSQEKTPEDPQSHGKEK